MHLINVLILTANPSNMGADPLRLDAEVRRIEEAFQRSQHRDRFQVTAKLAMQTIDLRRALLDHRPQIVHFSGHGTGEKGLVLENDAGKMQLVSTEALAGLFGIFEMGAIECVLLNACYSEIQAMAIHQYVDCVIGMNQPIGDKAAVRFAEGFYDALGAGSDYEEAFKIGCSAIALEGSAEYSTPVLKYRKRSGASMLGAQRTGQGEPSESVPVTEPSPRPAGSQSIGNITTSGSGNTISPVMAGGNATISQNHSQNRSVSIGGNMTGSTIQTGDGNTASVQFHQTTLPPAGSVDIKTELNALRDLLVQIDSPDRRKIDNALADVEDELKKPEPDKGEVGQALERAFNYAQKAEGFSAAIEKLQPRMTKVVAWLGGNWYKLLSVVRLGVGI